jgi:hypothetical protein
MSQQQKIARLMDWIETRPEEEMQIFEDGINAIVDLAEDVLRELMAERDNDNNHPSTPSLLDGRRPMSVMSFLMLPSPAQRRPPPVTALPVPSIISSLRLPPALSIHEGVTQLESEPESEVEDVEYHRHLTLQRLEGRALNDEANEDAMEDRVRLWVQHQGVEQWEPAPVQATAEPTRQVALVRQPLRRTRCVEDLRVAAEDSLAVEAAALVMSSNHETADSPGGHFPLSPEARFQSIRLQIAVRRRSPSPSPEVQVTAVETESGMTDTSMPKSLPRTTKREKIRRFFHRLVRH